jgi:hypothetical protein
MKNKTLSLAVSILLVCAMVMPVTASFEAHVSLTRVEEIQKILQELVNETAEAHDVFMFSENIAHDVEDYRFTLLRAFNDMVIEASAMQSRARNNRDSIIISMIAEPDGFFNDTFTIAFTSEEYFPLIPLISEFTGIEEDMMEIEIQEVFEFLLKFTGVPSL